MVICLIGPSGAGKDTQAEILSERLNIPTFSIGAVMRRLSAEKHPLAMKSMEFAKEGKWAPAEITVSLMMEYISEHTPDGFIVTGFPRGTKQFSLLEEKLLNKDLAYSAVIHYKLPDEIALRRMKQQATEMAAAGTPRPDATEKLMLERLNSYHKTIEPVLAMASSKKLLIEIDAIPDKQEIAEATLQALSTK